jgi:hypothetical protein
VNTEKILKLVNELKGYLMKDNVDRIKEIDAIISKSYKEVELLYKNIPNETTTLAMIIAECIEDIRRKEFKSSEKNMASSGKDNIIKAAKRILKNAKKHPNEGLHYMLQNDGNYYISDGYRAVKFTEKLPFEPIPENLENSGLAMTLKSFFLNSLKNYLELDPIDISEVKVYIKTEKAKRKKEIVWDFGEGKPAVNAQYLIDIMECFSEKVNAYYISENKPIYFVSKNKKTEAVLMPVRKPNKQ